MREDQEIEVIHIIHRSEIGELLAHEKRAAAGPGDPWNLRLFVQVWSDLDG
jgi:hypothetical protein